MNETGVSFPGETEAPAERMVFATWVPEKRELEQAKRTARGVRFPRATRTQLRRRLGQSPRAAISGEYFYDPK